MTVKEKLDHKQILLDISKRILEERIAANQYTIDNAQAAANEEGKSSAGDKYETSRAMSHLEKEMYSKQLASNKNELAALLNIDCIKLMPEVAPGSVIKCAVCSFFIAAGLGKIKAGDEIVYFLSPHAPLAVILYQKKQGENILLNGKNTIILDIY